ncbi:DNA binding domain-containing protein, excisionase family [Paraburkholderia phenazinium]|uniref:DNA binding domain-containing protein, excisionase family n=1 Tax=Paraburkholderia phenazinium TaxID=60549 RepID=A0A1G7Y8U8_9BURK|nr:helix-turn-helix domain-containing protein [Paraburkholderia phenazinium]SDG92908.1 DNA binding domain-containing protein, excisionase family [Paraburkholderia phenazinium]
MTARARATPIIIEGRPSLGLPDAAVYLGLARTSRAGVWRKIQAGEVHGVQDARGTWFVPVAELDRYLAQAAGTSSVGVREAAVLLDVSASTVLDWAERGTLHGTKDGRGRWAFARKAVEAHAATLAEQRAALTATQAVRYCALGHVNTLNEAVTRGELQAFVDASGRRRFHVTELDRFLASRAKHDHRLPGTLSTQEVADALGLATRSSVPWLAEHGRLDRVRIGRYWRYSAKTVQALKRERDTIQAKG